MTQIHMIPVDMIDPYEAFTRKYHPQGYNQGWWAGVTRRPGAKRVTDICQHRHGSAESAQECAERLASLRDGRADS